MGEEQAVPAVPVEPQRLIEVVMRIAARLHPDVFHREDQVTRLRELGGTSVLIAVRFVENLSNFAVPHEADDRRQPFPLLTVAWFESEVTKQSLSIEFDRHFLSAVCLVLRLLSRRKPDRAFVGIHQPLDELLPLPDLPLLKVSG